MRWCLVLSFISQSFGSGFQLPFTHVNLFKLWLTSMVTKWSVSNLRLHLISHPLQPWIILIFWGIKINSITGEAISSYNLFSHDSLAHSWRKNSSVRENHAASNTSCSLWNDDSSCCVNEALRSLNQYSMPVPSPSLRVHQQSWPRIHCNLQTHHFQLNGNSIGTVSMSLREPTENPLFY